MQLDPHPSQFLSLREIGLRVNRVSGGGNQALKEAKTVTSLDSLRRKILESRRVAPGKCFVFNGQKWGKWT
jgi:hypothetical protein